MNINEKHSKENDKQPDLTCSAPQLFSVDVNERLAIGRKN
jgi:hypothetical protein